MVSCTSSRLGDTWTPGDTKDALSSTRGTLRPVSSSPAACPRLLISPALGAGWGLLVASVGVMAVMVLMVVIVFVVLMVIMVFIVFIGINSVKCVYGDNGDNCFFVLKVFIGDNDLNGVHSAYGVDVNTYSMLIFEL